MFYTADLLAKKGRLSVVWLAAHIDRRLTKQDVANASIEEAVRVVVGGQIPALALRTSSHILLGLSRLFLRKTKLFYDDCTSAFSLLGKPLEEAELKQPLLVRCALQREITCEADLASHLDRINARSLAPPPDRAGSISAEASLRGSIECVRDGQSMQPSGPSFLDDLDEIPIEAAETLSGTSAFSVGKHTAEDQSSARAAEEMSVAAGQSQEAVGDGEARLAKKRKSPEEEQRGDRGRGQVDRNTFIPPGSLAFDLGRIYEDARVARSRFAIPKKIKELIGNLPGNERAQADSLSSLVPVEGSYLSRTSLSSYQEVVKSRGSVEVARDAEVEAMEHFTHSHYDLEVESSSDESAGNSSFLLALLEGRQEGAGEIEFCSFVSTHPRTERAKAFLSLLFLASRGKVGVRQEEYLGEIRCLFI